MSAAIADFSDDDRFRLADWIGERPETVLAIAALRSGAGRLWIDGEPCGPSAVLVESAVVPGEPQGFGDGDALLRLLDVAERWGCVEVDAALAGSITQDFDRRWGLAQTVTDVVHEMRAPAAMFDHPLVRQLTKTEAIELPIADNQLLPDRQLAAQAAEHGRLFTAIEDGVVVGHGASLAAGERFADVGVHVAETHRVRGVATACASNACQALQRSGLTPVWGTGAENAASLAVAYKLGFVETARLTFLVRDDLAPGPSAGP